MRKNSSLGVVSPSALPGNDVNGIFYGKSCSRLNSNVFDDYAYNITINREEFNVKLDSVKMHSGAMRNDVHYKLGNGNFLFFLVEGMGSKDPSKLYWQNVSENFETLPPEKADCMYDATYPTIDYYSDNDKIWSIVSFYDSTEKRYKANLHEFSRKDGAYLGLNRTLQHPFTNHAGRDFKLSRAGKLYAAGLQAFYPDSIDMDTVTGYVRPVGRNSYFLYEKDAGFMDSVFIGKYSAVTYIDHALELSNNKFLIAGNLPKDSSNEYKSSFFMALIDTQSVQTVSDKPEQTALIFPNPAGAGNTLTYLANEPIKKAILYDLNGKSTELSLINSQNIRINDDINKGVYSLMLYFDGGRVVSTKIIIK